MRTEFAKLLKLVRKANSEADEALIRRAYRFAEKAHRTQMRKSGEPYITHCLAVANHLVALGMDSTTVSAGILHDVLEDTEVTLEELETEFNHDIALLVDGVTKIGGMHIAATPVTREEKQAENLRKMLVATARDVRVIIIKLADRLHNLQTIEFLDKNQIERICRESLDIYVPMANRLGLSRWQWEMEDHAFQRLHPREYKEIARLVAMKRREREALLNEIITFLEERLKEAEVTARVIGRPKHLYSIYHKMEGQGKTFDQVYDVLALRIITQTVGGCYNSLGVVHHLWPPVGGRFKDFIAVPKLNMYQSIHTTVTYEGSIPIEIQIRTEEMDRASREGIAAHWKYKDGVQRVDQNTENQLRWLRQMYEWLEDAQAPDELFDSLRRDISMSAVYANTPNGEVKELPVGATPIDFAYMIHSDIGHRCIGARVNGSMVPLRYHLETGDVVEILTSKNQTPHVDWLEVVVTGRARTRIRQKLRELRMLPPIAGGGPRPTSPERVSRPKAKIRVVDEATRQKLVRIEGASGMEISFAKCCRPMPGNPIIGYMTKRQGLTIHKGDCRLLEKSEHAAERMVEASWEGDTVIDTTLQVTVGSRPNVLADITGAIRPMNLEISHAEYQSGDNGASIFEFMFRAPDRTTADRVIRLLRNVSGVTQVDSVAPPKTKK